MWMMTTGEIAKKIGAEMVGDTDVEITDVASLKDAETGDLGYVADESYRSVAEQSNASALIVSAPVENFSGVQMVCDDPEVAFLRILQSIRAETSHHPEGIHTKALISSEAERGQNVSIGAYTVVEAGAVLDDEVVVYPHTYIGHDVHIGAETVVHPHVTICESVQIGKRCIIRPNTVIGDDGFGFVQREGQSYRMQHVGAVRIGDDTEVGGLSSIDRGMLEDTVIGNGVKIDKHCHVAHNCTIEDDCILAGYARMGGSCTIRRGAVLAADVRIRDHIEIGEGAVLAAGTGAVQDVEADSKMWGVPARPLREEMRLTALIGRLPKMRQTIRDLKSQVEDLKKQRRYDEN